jgi:hypothetical protein
MSDKGLIEAKREAAARARRLANHFTSADDRARALKFATDLEAEADRLERATSPRPAGAVVTQVQMQQQQAAPAKVEGRKDDETES